MDTLTIAKTEVWTALDGLSPEAVREVRDFVAFLRAKTTTPRQLIRLGGLWQSLPPLSDADLREARQELWGQLGEETL